MKGGPSGNVHRHAHMCDATIAKGPATVGGGGGGSGRWQDRHWLVVVQATVRVRVSDFQRWEFHGHPLYSGKLVAAVARWW